MRMPFARLVLAPVAETAAPRSAQAPAIIDRIRHQRAAATGPIRLRWRLKFFLSERCRSLEPRKFLLRYRPTLSSGHLVGKYPRKSVAFRFGSDSAVLFGRAARQLHRHQQTFATTIKSAHSARRDGSVEWPP